MGSPRSACGAPPRGLSPDVQRPVDLARLAKGRAAKPGAACRARPRTGAAGSVAADGLKCRRAVIPGSTRGTGRTGKTTKAHNPTGRQATPQEIANRQSSWPARPRP